MQTSIITVSLDKSTLTKSLHGYSGAFPDFHIVSRSGGVWRVNRKIPISVKVPLSKSVWHFSFVAICVGNCPYHLYHIHTN